MFLPTLREVPSEAVMASHRLLLRGGFIRMVSAGVYVYLPLGLKVLNRIANIVREEAGKAGCVELLMPTLVPFELLRETGRDTVEVLFKTVDRTRREFALGFTHEEVVTDIARAFVHSYKQMPLCLYQIQTKFRDEPRPRGGLIRGKEFLMFDAYSFDADDGAADIIYKKLWKAYEAMFRRMGLQTLVCEAEAGDIGGTDNHEFMVLADAGEDSVLVDDKSGTATNAERCDIGGEYPEAECGGIQACETVNTPGARTVDEVTSFLGVGADRLLKTLLVKAGERRVGALIRGDRELNPYKLARRIDVSSVEMMSAEEVREITGADVGFAGPIGLKDVEIIADQEINTLSGFVVGANADGKHIIHACHGRDFHVDRFEDIRTAEDGDPAVGGGTLKEVRGIEVGHIFKLGCKYSEAMGATFDDSSGKELPIIMGCYGLGIGRSLQAIAEVSNDKDGLIWPISAAPFEVIIVLVNPDDDVQVSAAENLYEYLSANGVDALLDDRPDRAGSKFKDADLIGYPLRVVCGRGVAEGNVEVKWRREEVSNEVPLSDAGEIIVRMVCEERAKYQ